MALHQLRALPEQAVLSLLRRLKPEVHPPDTLLIQEGLPNRKMFLVSSGVLNVWKHYSTIHLREHISTLHKNDFFGEQSLISKGDQRANATVQTVSFCDMLILRQEDFEEVLRPHADRLATMRTSQQQAVHIKSSRSMTSKQKELQA